jgi:hypothetical protein
VDFTLSARQTAVHDFTLSPDEVPGNMLRNSAFRLNWLAENQPDAWYPKDQPDARYPIKHRTDAPFWEGELVPLNAGTNYRLQAKWPNTSAGQVVVRLLSPAVFAKLPTELKPLMPGETELIFPATKDTAYAQVLIYAEGSPSAAIDHLSLTPVP